MEHQNTEQRKQEHRDTEAKEEVRITNFYISSYQFIMSLILTPVENNLFMSRHACKHTHMMPASEELS